jgi:hypothetical protein
LCCHRADFQVSRPAGLWRMVKLPMDVQRTKESSDACQRSSSSQVDVFKAFLHAMAGESHDRAARVGIFGGAVQVVDGVLSGGQTGGVLACGEAWSRKKETRPRLWLVHAARPASHRRGSERRGEVVRRSFHPICVRGQVSQSLWFASLRELFASLRSPRHPDSNGIRNL